jgi:hypothetical protein
MSGNPLTTGRALRFIWSGLIILATGGLFSQAAGTSQAQGDGQPVYLPLVAAGTSSPLLAGCPVFPENNIWNTPIDELPVHTRSAAYIDSIGNSEDDTLHPDFGSGTWEGSPIGIPYTTVPGTQPRVPIEFYYADESDPGPYPIPADALIEGGSDHHILVLDRDDCILYEIFDASTENGGETWQAGSGAIFDLRSNNLRPETWTSSDAAGLPILPGLVRYDEIAAGEIRHAIRFTAAETANAFVWPARHEAGDGNPQYIPPMGQRFRLKSSFNISGYSPEVRVILRAMQVYGLILADNGSDWYISGVPDPRWDNDHLRELKTISGGNFEAVDVSGLMIDPDSGAARD